jgi:hypothetical protein
MFDPEKKTQYAKEAAAAAAFALSRGLSGVGPHETIESQPAKAYRPPSFVETTAGGPLCEQLRGLLHEAWEVNEMCAGLKCREAEAYLCGTGQNRPLARQLTDWVSKYLQLRLTSENPKDRGDSLRKYCRLTDELDRIFQDKQHCPRAINYLLLAPPLVFGRWLVYDRTWRRDVRHGPGQVTAISPATSLQTLQVMATLLAKFGWEPPVLHQFVAACEAGIGGDRNTTTDADVLRASVQEKMHLIGEMRPFLLDTRPERLRPERSTDQLRRARAAVPRLRHALAGHTVGRPGPAELDDGSSV